MWSEDRRLRLADMEFSETVTEPYPSHSRAGKRGVTKVSAGPVGWMPLFTSTMPLRAAIENRLNRRRRAFRGSWHAIEPVDKPVGE